MLKTSTQALTATPLSELGAIRVHGPDGLRFLQGQLSNDTQGVTASQSQLAGLHTPQGRAVALLRLVLVAPDEVVGVLPRELAAPVAARLAKYVLRAKAKVSDASSDWSIVGLSQASATSSGSSGAASTAGSDAPSDVGSLVDRGRDEPTIVSLAGTREALPTGTGAQARLGSGVAVCVDQSPGRWLVVVPSAARGVVETEFGLDASAAATGMNHRDAWRAADIAHGIPQVYGATSEAFVAQMLNLDVLGGVSFEKGCYTGQEVIARAHFRGRVKRRMQRFRTGADVALAPGDSGSLSDGRHFQVVDAVRLADGRTEFLAVAPIATGTAAESPETTTGPADASSIAAASAASSQRLAAEQLPLPYSLPA